MEEGDHLTLLNVYRAFMKVGGEAAYSLGPFTSGVTVWSDDLKH